MNPNYNRDPITG